MKKVVGGFLTEEEETPKKFKKTLLSTRQTRFIPGHEELVRQQIGNLHLLQNHILSIPKRIECVVGCHLATAGAGEMIQGVGIAIKMNGGNQIRPPLTII